VLVSVLSSLLSPVVSLGEPRRASRGILLGETQRNAKWYECGLREAVREVVVVVSILGGMEDIKFKAV